MDKIHFIITGGTIDSHYDGMKDTAAPNEESIVPAFIKNLKLPIEYEFTTVCMKDSRAITDEDRVAMANVIKASSAKKFIITHGTYTMPDTARYLEDPIRGGGKTVILTGAFVPLTDTIRSDGGFNIGFALAQMQHIDPAVYVCMNGQILKASEAMKIVTEGRFASRDEGVE